MKKILFLFVWVFAFTACTKEEVVDSCVKPQLYLDSCVVSGNSNAIAYIRLDKGENFFKHKLQLVLYDMESVDQQVAAFDVPLGGEREQKLEKNFTLPVAGKAYLVSLVMKTDKNSFVSNYVTVVSSDMQLQDRFFYTHGTPYYYSLSDKKNFCTDGVGAVGVAGERFLIEVPKCSDGDEFQIKVGNKLIKTESYKENDVNGTCKVWGEIPDLSAGKYEVSLVWRGVDIPLEEKLQILPWKVNEEATCPVTEFANLPHSTTNSYRIGSKIYYCSVYSDAATHVVYDCETKKWINLKDIPYRITSIVSVGNKAYAITDNFSIDKDIQEKDYIVEYNPADDSWKKIAPFPNDGNMCSMHLFVASGNLYMCDGVVPNKSFNASSERIAQVWKFNLKTGKWNAMGDLPSKLGHNGEHRVEYFCGESVGYAMDYANGQIWTYDPARDKWTYESLLKTQYYGANASIMEYNGKLLYFGFGGNNSSAYTYDFKTRTWELLAVYQWALNTPIILPMAIHNNKLMVGPFRDNYFLFECLYFLTVDI